MVNAYRGGEEHLLLTAKFASRSSVPADANMIGSHVICELKINYDASFKLKARIAHHSNEDSQKDLIPSDCSIFPRIGVRLVHSTSSLQSWSIIKADVKSPFLKSGRVQRDV